MERVSRTTRASWWCGWLPRKEWITKSLQGLAAGPPLPSAFPASLLEGQGDEPFPSVCPGYSTILPAVSEAARALSWRKEGMLSEFFDGEPLNEVVKDALDILAEQVALVERHAIRYGMQKAKKQGGQGV
jgi:hypothetical protein